jgi:GTPase SAR1 family protein/outer membrane protein assembly factor BamD (BamD/ComL family)
MADPTAREILDHLERHLTAPRKVGLFGHRNVGKTTLLAMFYRQASTGQVPDLRLSAPEPETAEYLAEKIARIEAGEPPAGTLSETELKLRLYHGSARYDLIVKDYQGEHVTLGSNEPILDFFADCDAVLFCLDPTGSTEPAERLRRQQEVEGLLETYLEQSRTLKVQRPIAIVVTKYDRVVATQGPIPVETLLEKRFGMTLHAIKHNAPDAATFAVSAYGPSGGEDGSPPAELEPQGLDAPLLWVASKLETIDRDQLDWLWDLAPHDYVRLSRCVKSFERRYPESPQAAAYRKRLNKLGRARLARRLGTALLLLVATAAALVAYDLAGYEMARRFEAEKNPAQAVARRWEEFRQWHPTFRWLFPARYNEALERGRDAQIQAEKARVLAGRSDPDRENRLIELKELAPERIAEIGQIEEVQAKRRHDDRWRLLRAEAELPDDDPSRQIDDLRSFLREFPDSPHREEAIKLANALIQFRTERQSTRDKQRLDSIRRAAELPNADLGDLLDRTRTFLEEHPQSIYRVEAEELIAKFTARMDDRDFTSAVEFSRRFPTQFAARIEKYDAYLKTYASGGRHLTEALQAKSEIFKEWDLHSYRQAYQHIREFPNDLDEGARRLNDYLRVHPNGRFTAAAQAYLDWIRKISEPHEYQVTLKRGQVEDSVGSNPDLSVTIEVGGVTYGPSPTIPGTSSPVWDYTFPKPVVWKRGDPVAITITKHGFLGSRDIYTLYSAKDDPLAMKLLSTTIRPAGGGKTLLVFESDFNLPSLPKPE